MIAVVLLAVLLAVHLTLCMLLHLFPWCRSYAGAIISCHAGRGSGRPTGCWRGCSCLVISPFDGYLLLISWGQHKAGIPVDAQLGCPRDTRYKCNKPGWAVCRLSRLKATLQIANSTALLLWPACHTYASTQCFAV